MTARVSTTRISATITTLNEADYLPDTLDSLRNAEACGVTRGGDAHLRALKRSRDMP